MNPTGHDLLFVTVCARYHGSMTFKGKIRKIYRLFGFCHFSTAMTVSVRMPVVSPIESLRAIGMLESVTSASATARHLRVSRQTVRVWLRRCQAPGMSLTFPAVRWQPDSRVVPLHRHTCRTDFSRQRSGWEGSYSGAIRNRVREQWLYERRPAVSPALQRHHRPSYPSQEPPALQEGPLRRSTVLRRVKINSVNTWWSKKSLVFKFVAFSWLHAVLHWQVYLVTYFFVSWTLWIFLTSKCNRGQRTWYEWGESSAGTTIEQQEKSKRSDNSHSSANLSFLLNAQQSHKALCSIVL